MAAAAESERIAAVLAGERPAFDALYDALLPLAWRLAATRCRERGAAEALARAILTHAFRHLEDRPAGRSLEPWLEAIAEELGVRRRAAGPGARAAAATAPGG